MPSFKNSRMSEDIHRELTDILRSVKDPRVSDLLSVVRVELSQDGSHCKVYVSSLRGWDDTVESVKGLQVVINKPLDIIFFPKRGILTRHIIYGTSHTSSAYYY